MHEAQAWNTRLIGHTDLNGFGDGSQIMLKGHYAYVAHMLKKALTIVDVADPTNPRVVKQLENPPNVHSHKVQIVDNVMLVNQEGLVDGPPIDRGGIILYDISDPTEPRQIGQHVLKGKGVHRPWFVDGRYAHVSATGEGFFKYTHLTLDVSDPAHIHEVGRWWMPGQWLAQGETPENERFSAHSTIVQGDRGYVSYRDGGVFILDLSDLANPRPLSRVDWSPPYGGNAHTYLPLGDRGIAIATDEATAQNCQEPLKLAWVVDIRVETNPITIATLPVPKGPFCEKGGRFGPHNVHENRPGSLVDHYLVYLTYFNAGLRIYDTSDPLRPEEVGYYVPATPPGQAAIQINDVYVHADGLIYITDRKTGGLYIVEYTGPRPR